MEYYEQFKKLSGDEKLDRVQKMVLLVLLSHTKDEQKRNFYKDITPLIIELVVQISKRSMVIKQRVVHSYLRKKFHKNKWVSLTFHKNLKAMVMHYLELMLSTVKKKTKYLNAMNTVVYESVVVSKPDSEGIVTKKRTNKKNKRYIVKKHKDTKSLVAFKKLQLRPNNTHKATREITYDIESNDISNVVTKTKNNYELNYFPNYNGTSQERWEVRDVGTYKYDTFLTKVNETTWTFQEQVHSSLFNESASNPAWYTLKYSNDHYLQDIFTLNGARDFNSTRFSRYRSGQQTFTSASYPILKTYIKPRDSSWFIFFKFNKPSVNGKRLFNIFWNRNWGWGKELRANAGSNGVVRVEVRLTGSGQINLEKTYSLKSTGNTFYMSYSNPLENGDDTKAKVRLVVNNNYAGYVIVPRETALNSNTIVDSFKPGLSGDNNVLEEVIVGRVNPNSIAYDGVPQKYMYSLPWLRSFDDTLNILKNK